MTASACVYYLVRGRGSRLPAAVLLSESGIPNGRVASCAFDKTTDAAKKTGAHLYAVHRTFVICHAVFGALCCIKHGSFSRYRSKLFGMISSYLWHCFWLSSSLSQFSSVHFCPYDVELAEGGDILKRD